MRGRVDASGKMRALEVTGYGAFAASALTPDQVVDSIARQKEHHAKTPIHSQPTPSQPQQARKHPQPTQSPSRIRCGVPQMPRKRVRPTCEHPHPSRNAPGIPREHPQKRAIKTIITVAIKAIDPNYKYIQTIPDASAN
jgi:hypothetical protein